MKAARWTALAFAISLAIELLAAGIRLPPGGALLGFGSDPDSFVWYLEWWPWAVLHGHDPLHSDLVFTPGGYSMAWGTSVPTAALLALPATLTWGPVVAFDLLTLLAHPLAATTMFVLAWEITGDAAASVLAGLIFGFCGYENGQTLGHLNLDLVFLLPIVVWLCVRRWRGRLGRTGFVGLLGLVMAAQFGLSAEILATTALSGALALAVLAAFADRAWRWRLGVLALDTAAGCAFAALLLSPMLVEMAQSARAIPDFVNPPAMYSNDLANLVLPTRAEALHSGWTERLAGHFTGNAEEQDLYLGLPLLLIVVLFAAGRLGRRSRLALATITALLLLASLGPVLHAGGRTWPVPLPWRVVMHVPLLRGALPCRLGVFVALAASIAAGFWLSERRGNARLWVGTLACLFLLPGDARSSWTTVGRPCLFTPRAIAASLGHDPDVLLLPFGSGSSMLWQAEAGMSFRQAGGLLSFVPLSYQSDPVTLDLLRNDASDVIDFAQRHGAGFVLAGPGTSPAIRRTLARSGRPVRTVCGVEVISLRP